MLWNLAPLLFCLLTIHASPTHSFIREKPTEKPEVPPNGSPSPRHPRPPTHISEFTDPQTGLNPFLDLEEGPTSIGRNVMEDERRNDNSMLDFDIVEGDSTYRKDFEKQPFEEPSVRWEDFEESHNDLPIVTPSTSSKPTTKMELFVTLPQENVKVLVHEVEGTIPEKIMEEKVLKGSGPVGVSDATVIYASATVAVVAAVALLVGACWWRKKLKLSRSPSAVENGELKS